MKILVVDDKEEERYLAETLLKGSGYEVETAVNGAEALEKLRTEGFDIIVSDVLMPVMDGVRFCRECKGDEKLKDIPFIFYTATYKDERDEELASKVGAEKFIRKPLEPEEFVKLIQGVFRDMKKGKIEPKKPVLEEEREVLKLYSERLIGKLEKKMLELEAEIAKRKRSQEEIEYLNRLLSAIRSVNQLIVKEKERDKLLKNTCATLIKTGSYESTCICLFDESGMLVAHAEAGSGGDFLPMVERLKRGELTDCIKRTLIQSGVVITKASSLTCGDCPLVKTCSSTKVVTVRIEHGGKVYGLLKLQLSGALSTSREEQSLLQEVTNDIAFALRGMELEEEHKQAEEELRTAEQNFRNSLDNSPLGIRVVTVEGELLYANQTILDIYGYSSVEELKATPAKKRYTPESYAGHQERIKGRKLGKPIPSSYEISIVRKDGEVRHLIASRKEVLWGGETQFQTLYQDVTERKKAERDLSERMKELECLYGIAMITERPAITLDAVYQEVVNVIPPGWQYLDITCARVTINGKEFMTPNFRETAWKQASDIIADGQRIGAIEVFYLEEKPECDEGPFLKEERRLINGIARVLGDYIQRKRTEDEIKRAAKEWSTTFDSITDLVSICDKDFKLAMVNKAFADAFKKKPKELIGKPCYEIAHGTKEPLPNCPHEVTIKTKKPATAEFFEPHLGIHLEVATSPIFNEKGDVVASVHIIRDITERKKMQEQLIVTDRLASIGELASGIAHELNNPLTSVIGFSELLLEKDVPDDVKEDLKIINEEAKRTARVVRNLLTFARKHPKERQLININGIIEKVLELRAYEQKVSNIKVDTRFASNLPETMVNSFELQQVFINIVINAEHFMIEAHKEGNLTITTERVGDIIRASFADDGPGIAKENLEHLFDPFFTTKEIGKGTGLGLSICHGIVTAHGGRIYAESKLGKGATFVVELPVLTSGKGGTKNENS